jgi:hypothetical protein
MEVVRPNENQWKALKDYGLDLDYEGPKDDDDLEWAFGHIVDDGMAAKLPNPINVNKRWRHYHDIGPEFWGDDGIRYGVSAFYTWPNGVTAR